MSKVLTNVSEIAVTADKVAVLDTATAVRVSGKLNGSKDTETFVISTKLGQHSFSHWDGRPISDQDIADHVEKIRILEEEVRSVKGGKGL